MWNRPEVRERTRTQMEDPRRDDFAPFASRLAFLAFCMALAMMLPLSKASAQASAPAGAGESEVQITQPPAQGQPAPPITITLKDALERAQKLDAAFLGAVSDAKSADEDRLQARNAMLPTITATSQYLERQGDGGRISDGRFVTQDGVHVYRAWGVLHQDLSPGTLLMGTGVYPGQGSRGPGQRESRNRASRTDCNRFQDISTPWSSPSENMPPPKRLSIRPSIFSTLRRTGKTRANMLTAIRSRRRFSIESRNRL